MADTVEGLIQRARRELYGQHRAAFNLLNANLDTVMTSVPFTYPLQGVTQGAYIEIDDEMMYVWNTQATTGTATVQRGMQNTTPAVHTAGAVVTIDPRWPHFIISEKVKDEINSWPTQIFRIASVDIALAAGDATVDLTGQGGWLQVLEILMPPRTTGVITGGVATLPNRWRRCRFRQERTISATQYPNGVCFLTEPPPIAQSCRVTLAFPMDTNTAWTPATTTTAIGIPDSAVDIPGLGAAWRCLSTRDIKRTDTGQQGEERIATEVPVGAMGNVAAKLEMLRDKRLGEEAWKLRAQYPWKMT